MITLIREEKTVQKSVASINIGWSETSFSECFHQIRVLLNFGSLTFHEYPGLKGDTHQCSYEVPIWFRNSVESHQTSAQS